MKQLFFSIAILFSATAGYAQVVDNKTACTIRVTPICYDRTQCTPPVASCNTTFGIPVNYAAYSSAAAPGCTGATEVVVAYEICWDQPLMCAPVPPNCIEVGVPDAGGNPWGAGCPDCWNTFAPPGPWTYNLAFPAVLPACFDCVQPHGGNANVKVSPAGDVTVGP